MIYAVRTDGSYPFLVWFSDSDGNNRHRTPIAVRVTANSYSEARSRAITAARSKCQRHCDKAYAVRQPTAQEIKTAKTGWIRTGPKGQKEGYKGVSGVGPKLGTGTRKDSDEYLYECITERIDDLFSEYEQEYLLVKTDIIERNGDQYILWNKDKTKKLGTFETLEEAEKREKQIKLFKAAKNNPELAKKIKADKEEITEGTLKRINKVLNLIAETNQAEINSIIGDLDD